MAKFKVGDVVSLKDGYSVPSGASGNRAVVVEVLRPAGGDFNYWLRFDGGREREQNGDHLVLANAARNAVIEKKLPPRGAGVYIEQQGGSFAVGPTNDGWSVANYGGEGVNFAHGFKTVSEAKSWCSSKGYKVEDVILANSLRSRNAVVQKALNSALPIGDIGVSDSTILWRMIGGGRDEPYHDEYQKRLDRMNQENITDETKVILKKYGYRFKNSDTSVLRETAVNGVWETESKLEREIARTVGADIDVGIYGSAIAIGGVPDEASAGKAKEIVARMFGPVASWQVKKDIIGYTIHAKVARPIPNASNSTNAVVAKAMNAQAVCNASYSAALKAIMDAVKPYMDRRITDDTSWRYPALVISKLRDVCERAVMSAGRYDGKRPPHRVYDVECVKDGFKFSGNLIVSGLLHRDDPDDVSAFDEYDMILSLGYVGKATNASRVARNGRDELGMLTVGTKVKYGSGKTGEIVKVKKDLHPRIRRARVYRERF